MATLTTEHDFAAEGNSILQAAIKDGEGAAINISGYTITLRYSIDGADSRERDMPITDAANGLADYQFVDNELSAGQMTAEVHVDDGSDTELPSLTTAVFTIRERLPAPPD